MAIYSQNKKIMLEEAMNLQLEQRVRVWSFRGLCIEVEELPKNIHVQTTFVMKVVDSPYQLVVSYTEGCTNMFRVINEYESLKELKDNYPGIFELEGEIYAFA